MPAFLDSMNDSSVSPGLQQLFCYFNVSRPHPRLDHIDRARLHVERVRGLVPLRAGRDLLEDFRRNQWLKDLELTTTVFWKLITTCKGQCLVATELSMQALRRCKFRRRYQVDGLGSSGKSCACDEVEP
jgi:hypothetical protein